jgi:hypothetical protein
VNCNNKANSAQLQLELGLSLAIQIDGYNTASAKNIFPQENILSVIFIKIDNIGYSKKTIL